MYDIIIIGGGVIGCVTARELSRYRLKIAVVEAGSDVAVGATKANSAIVHAGFDAKEGTQKARLNVRGSEMMPKLCQELGVSYTQNGSLVLGFSDADRITLEALLTRGRNNGVKDLQILNRSALNRLEPNIGDEVLCALYAPTGGIVCPYGLAIAAMGNAMDNGAELFCNFAVDAIRKTDEGFIVCAGERSLKARRIINAAGVYADTVARMVGDSSFTITPRRGEYMLLDKACGKMIRSTLFQTPTAMGKGILVTPTVDGNLLLGPTAEDCNDKTCHQTTTQGLKSVSVQAQRYVKGINLRQTITSFCGLRAVGSTGDFIINRPVAGFINAAGIESPGLSASPAIAEELVHLLEEDGMKLTENPDFNPIRQPMHAFAHATAEEKNQWIHRDPAYGKIVCRCEGITEGELRAACRQNPKPADLDGLKRRTRARMGRCQGGFCTPSILNILSEELGKDLLTVTQNGNGNLLVGKTKEENHD